MIVPTQTHQVDPSIQNCSDPDKAGRSNETLINPNIQLRTR